MTQIHTKEQRIALGEYLSCYPEDMLFEDIIQALESSNIYDAEIVIFEAFEDFHTSTIANFIVGLHDTLVGEYVK